MSRYAAVVRLYREGATNPEIAERLNLAPNTVKSYLSRARREGDLPARLSDSDPRHCPSCGAPSGRWRHEPRYVPAAIFGCTFTVTSPSPLEWSRRAGRQA